ncbi:unnamed protein product, partial [Chrysoparadoxa australica]
MGPEEPSKRHPIAQGMPCSCSESSLSELQRDQTVVLALSEPYRNFDSNHWFHIGEYYLSRHEIVDPWLPANSTVYILAPNETFVDKLVLVTFFFLLLAFTDTSTHAVKVMPREAFAGYVARDVLALDTRRIRSLCAWDSNLSVFKSMYRVNGEGTMMAMGGLGEVTELSREVGPVGEGEEGEGTCTCSRYIGDFGSAPIERGFWFGSDDVVLATRERIDMLCGGMVRTKMRESKARGGREGNSTNRTHRLVIYQRNKSRRLRDSEAVQSSLKELLGGGWEVVLLLHDDATHPCGLYRQLHDADVLLTPHGFQSMLALFMPPKALLFEVFPYKYWKDGYAPMVAEWGLTYDAVMSRSQNFWSGVMLFFVSQANCMRSIYC